MQTPYASRYISTVDPEYPQQNLNLLPRPLCESTCSGTIFLVSSNEWRLFMRGRTLHRLQVYTGESIGGCPLEP